MKKSKRISLSDELWGNKFFPKKFSRLVIHNLIPSGEGAKYSLIYPSTKLLNLVPGMIASRVALIPGIILKLTGPISTGYPIATDWLQVS